MVSEKPPRHSKSKSEPVTIDLDPKDVKRSTDVDKKPEATPVTPTVKAGESQATQDKAAEDKKAEAVSATPKEPISPSVRANEPKPETVGAQQWSKGPDIKLSASQATSSTEKPASTANKPEAPQPSTPPKSNSTPPPYTKPSSADSSNLNTKAAQKGTSTSGAIAAGIFGGLITLLAAGSLQYAGYIPGLAQTTSDDALGSLRNEIEALKQSISNQAAQQPTFDSSALEQRLAALESTTAPQTIGLDGVDGLSGKISGFESQIASLKSALDEATVTNKGLTERLTAAEEKINEPRDDIEVARAIAAAALKAAIDRGGPFITELDTLVQVTPEDQQLKALQPFAATGVPSRSEILKAFPAQANEMLDIINQPDPNLGIVDRLTQSAMSLVKVRPVGNVAGDTPEAVIARIEDKLRNGDLKGASLEWDTLPEQAKTTGSAFKKSLDARVQVEELVGSAVTRALTKNAEQG